MLNLLLISILGIYPVLGFINAGRSPSYGCMRSGVHYAEGAPVPSDELCQDCECTAGEVTCVMQKCRSARYNCKPVGFIKGTCCPLKFECDDGFNEIIPEIPFSNSEINTFRNTPRARSCISEGEEYISGQAVPVTSPCHTHCSCIDGAITCIQDACPPPPPAFLRCDILEVPNECCPEYSCPFTAIPKKALSCEYEGVEYDENAFVPTADPCTDCYCVGGEVVCAFHVCPEPLAANCRPVTSGHETCCPQKYECSLNSPPEEIVTTETIVATEDPFENLELTTTNEDLTSANDGGSDVVTDATVDINHVTENTEVAEEEKTTAIFEEVTETVALTSDDITTPEPIMSETTVSDNDDSNQEESLSLTTESFENELTTVANTEEQTEFTTKMEQTTGYDDADVTITTISNLVETPIVTTASSSIDIEQTTLNSSTDDNAGDEITTVPSSDNTTVTEDDMVAETTTLLYDDMCYSDGFAYIDGESIPPKSQCHESCYCRNGTVACIEKACSPFPPAFLRCATVEVTENSDECCPKYDCASVTPDSYNLCERDGIPYFEGEFVPSPDLCTDCYCMDGEILCAVLECYPPVRNSCAPIYDDERACCPQHYECDIDPDVQTTTMNQTAGESEASTDIPLKRFAL